MRRATRGWTGRRSAIRTTYRGITYASKSEARYAAYLDVLKKGGLVERWERQVRWPLVVNGEKVCVMVIDFRVWYTDGSSAFHEVKGWHERVWRLKSKLPKALYPDLSYVVIPAQETKAL